MRTHATTTEPPPEDVEQVSELFKALSDPIRARLVLLLTGGAQHVHQLVDRLALPQSTVSRHLAILRNARVVRAERQGTSMLYRLADAHVGDLVWEAFSHAEHARLGLPDHPAAPPQVSGVH